MKISRVHVQVFTDSMGYTWIRDLNSASGTKMNKLKLKPRAFAPLQDGIRVRLGDANFAFYSGEPPVHVDDPPGKSRPQGLIRTNARVRTPPANAGKHPSKIAGLKGAMPEAPAEPPPEVNPGDFTGESGQQAQQKKTGRRSDTGFVVAPWENQDPLQPRSQQRGQALNVRHDKPISEVSAPRPSEPVKPISQSISMAYRPESPADSSPAHEPMELKSEPELDVEPLEVEEATIAMAEEAEDFAGFEAPAQPPPKAIRLDIRDASRSDSSAQPPLAQPEPFVPEPEPVPVPEPDIEPAPVQEAPRRPLRTAPIEAPPWAEHESQRQLEVRARRETRKQTRRVQGQQTGTAKMPTFRIDKDAPPPSIADDDNEPPPKIPAFRDFKRLDELPDEDEDETAPIIPPARNLGPELPPEPDRPPAAPKIPLANKLKPKPDPVPDDFEYEIPRRVPLVNTTPKPLDKAQPVDAFPEAIEVAAPAPDTDDGFVFDPESLEAHAEAASSQIWDPPQAATSAADADIAPAESQPHDTAPEIEDDFSAPEYDAPVEESSPSQDTAPEFELDDGLGQQPEQAEVAPYPQPWETPQAGSWHDGPPVDPWTAEPTNAEANNSNFGWDDPQNLARHEAADPTPSEFEALPETDEYESVVTGADSPYEVDVSDEYDLSEDDLGDDLSEFARDGSFTNEDAQPNSPSEYPAFGEATEPLYGDDEIDVDSAVMPFATEDEQWQGPRKHKSPTEKLDKGIGPEDDFASAFEDESLYNSGPLDTAIDFLDADDDDDRSFTDLEHHDGPDNTAIDAPEAVDEVSSRMLRNLRQGEQLNVRRLPRTPNTDFLNDADSLPDEHQAHRPEGPDTLID